MAHIEFFYTLLSPFTYMCRERPREIAERHGATITYRPADFMAIFGETGGVPVPKRHPFRQAYRLQELPRLAKRSGVPITLHPKHWPVDATRACHAVIAASENGAETMGLSHAFLRACWADERDISDAGVIDGILSANGQPKADDLDMAGASETYAANTAMALEMGVFGAPFFVVGEAKFWGQDRLDYLEEHLASLG
ncbi:MAG: 2-hydroxychromene-2-carboxylate isomerase [Pseudomonadota bacterium]